MRASGKKWSPPPIDIRNSQKLRVRIMTLPGGDEAGGCGEARPNNVNSVLCNGRACVQTCNVVCEVKRKR
ncbi:hypothetical protein EVAR_60457_1 [Eumeta japonica]|uniref:Uncharacterized protein n=1 Tax=Eumeta variegata TaxID=151549 RepID=A0A4C1Z692_EUMVA|nr:hypothetical protein EVAR_60457_1 [Eumeta japonica]